MDAPRILEGAAWRSAWERAPADTRARIALEVKSGRAVRDPHEAALAVGLAVERRTTATYGFIAGIVTAVIVVGFGTRESASFIIAALAIIPLVFAAWAHSRRSAALKAELHNRDVVYETQAKLRPPPPDEPVSDPWEGLPPPRAAEGDEA